jgi:hypothetical protein
LNLSKLPGVENCKVSYKQGKAILVFADGTEPDGSVKLASGDQQLGDE